MPFWNSELYVEISSWFPFGKDYSPVSVNRFYDNNLKRIAASCIDLDSEFFFMASPLTGCVGNLPRENFFRYGPDNMFNLGFLMIVGYSDIMEKLITVSIALTEAGHGLSAGITACSLWSRGIFQGTTKVIAVASDDPFFDCREYLPALAKVLDDGKNYIGTNSNTSYYAEKFGYSRFFIQWEDEKPFDLMVSHAISEFELDDTKEIVGGSPNVEFPPFMGAAVHVQEVP